MTSKEENVSLTELSFGDCVNQLKTEKQASIASLLQGLSKYMSHIFGRFVVGRYIK